MSENLKLNPETIKEKNSMYSSLTDLYEVEIFTNKFRNTVENYQIKEIAEESTIYQNVFIKDLVMQAKNDQLLSESLFTGKIEQTIRTDYKSTQSNHTYYYGIASLGIILLFVVLLTRYYSKKKKEKMQYVVNSDNITL